MARLVNVAGYGVFFDRLGGRDAAAAAVRHRAGRYLDPDLSAAFADRAEELLSPTTAGDLSDRLLAAEPGPPVLAADADEALRVFGEAVDLKSPFLHGHSTTVFALADGACRRLGLADTDVMAARPGGDGPGCGACRGAHRDLGARRDAGHRRVATGPDARLPQ